MSDVLEKLGIFDLLAVLLTGVSVMTVSLLVFEAMCLDSVDIELDIEKALPFFVLSYLCGIALQEIGSLIEKKRFEGGIWTVFEKKTFKANPPKEGYLTDTYQYLKETLGAENAPEGADTHSNIVYDYCKRYAQDKKAMSQIDRFTCVCVMSRSLSLYFCLLSGFLLLLAVSDFSCLKLLLFAISASLCVLFYHRFERFTEIRYLSVFQIFYYDNRKEIEEWKQERDGTRDTVQVSG
ncbi:MAG: hypothetical protein IJT31_05645 [Oscillibacter sp.]|nr:hypothetical protein [Oscillibacter sp.]